MTYFQSEVKEKTLISDEYRTRLEETEKQLQEANERVENHDIVIHMLTTVLNQLDLLIPLCFTGILG